MRLTELEPKWTGYGTDDYGKIYDGISFLCPHCKVHRLAIHFMPPIDPENWWPRITHPTYHDLLVWTRVSGDTFDDLTITPSINVELANWHGFITNGEIR